MAVDRLYRTLSLASGTEYILRDHILIISKLWVQAPLQSVRSRPLVYTKVQLITFAGVHAFLIDYPYTSYGTIARFLGFPIRVGDVRSSIDYQSITWSRQGAVSAAAASVSGLAYQTSSPPFFRSLNRGGHDEWVFVGKVDVEFWVVCGRGSFASAYLTHAGVLVRSPRVLSTPIIRVGFTSVGSFSLPLQASA